MIETISTGRLYIHANAKSSLESGELRYGMTDVDENVSELAKLVDRIRSVNATAKLVMTLSPVPLVAAHKAGSVFEQDAISKGILRAAIFKAQTKFSFIYWPSYELVKWAAQHTPSSFDYQAFAAEDRNTLHPSQWLISEITNDFVRIFFQAKGDAN